MQAKQRALTWESQWCARGTLVWGHDWRLQGEVRRERGGCSGASRGQGQTSLHVEAARGTRLVPGGGACVNHRWPLQPCRARRAATGLPGPLGRVCQLGPGLSARARGVSSGKGYQLGQWLVSSGRGCHHRQGPDSSGTGCQPVRGVSTRARGRHLGQACPLRKGVSARAGGVSSGRGWWWWWWAWSARGAGE
jgi:hypothetical protein